MNFKHEIGEREYERTRRMIRTAFPGGDDDSCEDAIVDQFLQVCWATYSDQHRAAGIPAPPSGWSAAPHVTREIGPAKADKGKPGAKPAAGAPPLYLALANHARKQAPGTEFVGELPMVRVSLTKDSDAEIATPIGVVKASDHLLFNVKDVCERYASALGYHPERVDLITPARRHGARFAAVATYLGYKKKGDRAPSFYLLEAGLATGEASVLFFGETMDTEIVERTGYVPTPFAAEDHWYRGRQYMRDDDPSEVSALTVEAMKTRNDKPYLRVEVRYLRVAEPPDTWPAELTFHAALRLAVIGHRLGVQVWGFGPFTGAAAKIGAKLGWIDD